ncbi:hypothetical protein P154DRAFT_352989 [Amniculicola lignicola CBS 123094]|uniref:Uncharacterized protein n=1 Tax=Amniculicola lignicola CBS 123094 TaxID=1392246 RepID=A0A6A5X291_9PLEO|nr:hypothetical protein P154DRAFT_352989 [Amniculicola lignicola CBS 123094]
MASSEYTLKVGIYVVDISRRPFFEFSGGMTLTKNLAKPKDQMFNIPRLPQYLQLKDISPSLSSYIHNATLLQTTHVKKHNFPNHLIFPSHPIIPTQKPLPLSPPLHPTSKPPASPPSPL